MVPRHHRDGVHGVLRAPRGLGVSGQGDHLLVQAARGPARRRAVVLPPAAAGAVRVPADRRGARLGGAPAPAPQAPGGLLPGVGVLVDRDVRLPRREDAVAGRAPGVAVHPAGRRAAGAHLLAARPLVVAALWRRRGSSPRRGAPWPRASSTRRSRRRTRTRSSSSTSRPPPRSRPWPTEGLALAATHTGRASWPPWTARGAGRSPGSGRGSRCGGRRRRRGCVRRSWCAIRTRRRRCAPSWATATRVRRIPLRAWWVEDAAGVTPAAVVRWFFTRLAWSPIGATDVARLRGEEDASGRAQRKAERERRTLGRGPDL